MGSRRSALGWGSCFARFDTAYICWIDSADVSNRVGGFSSASWSDFLRGGDSHWFAITNDGPRPASAEIPKRHNSLEKVGWQSKLC